MNPTFLKLWNIWQMHITAIDMRSKGHDKAAATLSRATWANIQEIMKGSDKATTARVFEVAEKVYTRQCKINQSKIK